MRDAALPAAAAYDLDLVLGPGRDGRMTILSRHVRWPWSLPRGFYLEGPAGALSLLPQAAAAALLPGDGWRHRIAVDGGRARILSAGAMAVHAGGAARADWDLRIGAGAGLSLLPDPLVLFTGARVAQSVVAELAPCGRLVLLDGFCRRDPAAPPAGGEWRAALLVRRPCGTVLLRDGQVTDEAHLAALKRLPGAPAAFGTLIALGMGEALDAAIPPGPWEAPGVWGAMAELRGGAGRILRMAAVSGGALAATFARIRAALTPIL